MAGEQHFSDIPDGHTWVGGHLVRRPDDAGQRTRDAQGARAALAREVADSQIVSGTNTVSIRRYSGNLSEDTVQSWDHPDRIAARQLPPDAADSVRRRNADLTRSAASAQQLSGSSTVTGRDRRDVERFYERRFGGVLSVGERYAPPPIDWSSLPEAAD